MGILEIISAICLILSCVFIIIMVLMQDSKKGMSQALTGGSSESFYQKNSGRTKEARLAKATRTAAILFFVVTLIVNVFAIYFKAEPEGPDWSSLGLGEDYIDITNMTDDEIAALFGSDNDGDNDDGNDGEAQD